MGAVDHPHAQRGHGLHLLITALLAALALAGGPPRAVLDAEVGPGLDYVRGTLTIDAPTVVVVDPLADLPLPEEDRTSMRTFPGLVEQGSVTWTEIAPGTFAFHAWLPRRFGGVGATHHGLFANGAWYPQPVVDGDPLPTLEWEVRVRGPEGVVMALGSSVGGAEVRWTGTGERASLAVVPDGVVERLEGTKTYIVARRRVRPVLRKELGALTRQAIPEEESDKAVFVEAPLRRRLGRAGVEQALVSDRAFRVFPGLRRFHRVGLAREVAPAFVPLADPVHRDWVGASWAEDHIEELEGLGAADLSQKFRWIPSIDWLITSGTMPFFGEVLERRYIEDALHDDLVEVYAPHYPGPAVVQLLDDAGGEGAHRAAAAVMLAGAETYEVIPPTEPSAGLLEGWRHAVPDQDYQLVVEDGLPTVHRQAPPDAPPEWVRLQVDGATVPWRTGWGSDVWTWSQSVDRFTIDPGGHLSQRSRVGDRWPPRYALVGGGWIDNINLTDKRMTAALQGTIRGSADLRNSVTGTLSTSEQDLARARVSYTHRFGMPLDLRLRSHRVTLSATAGWHHAWYRDEVDTRYSLGALAAWVWSTRVTSTFPTRGSYASVSTSAGLAPEGGEVWGGFGTGVGTVLSWHPRWALDCGARFGTALGSGETRKLPLGGLTGVRGLDPDGLRGPLRAVQTAEVRWAPIRNASVPFGLGWGTELQLGSGLEVGEVYVDGKVETGVGAVFGAYVLGDILGLEPRGVGLTVALPLVVPEEQAPAQEDSVRVLLRWGSSL
ncbi:MAG: hypothetical protein EP330_29720 [Deltaproteobacteria bacterium]|nr:MAG: hypothetical protein EP330_29720 [Deltaproteobacteria bacterium]